MKKLLFTLGAIASVAIPVAAVVSCNDSSTGPKSGLGANTKDNSNSSTQSAHKYPTVTDDLWNRLERYAADFLNIKGAQYFTKYDSLKSGWRTTQAYDQKALSFSIPEQNHPSNMLFVTFDFKELYDYANSQSSANFPYLDN